MTGALTAEFREHLLRICDVTERDLDKLVDEVIVHWSECTEEYVRRRHRELQRSGLANRDIYKQIGIELTRRPFASSGLTERQIRRLIYG